MLEFLDFINVMRGKYQDATFQEKRNALDVLGVKVYIRKTDDGEFGKKGFTPKASKSPIRPYSQVFIPPGRRDINPSSAP